MGDFLGRDDRVPAVCWRVKEKLDAGEVVAATDVDAGFAADVIAAALPPGFLEFQAELVGEATQPPFVLWFGHFTSLGPTGNCSHSGQSSQM